MNTNLEYSFDLWEKYRGFKYAPIFVKKVRMNLFADALSIDGYYENIDNEIVKSRSFEEQFYSAGTEFFIEGNVGYQFPMSLIVGLYYGFTQEAFGGFSPFLGLVFGDLSSATETPSLKRSTVSGH